MVIAHGFFGLLIVPFIFGLFVIPILVFVPLYIFYPKGLANIFNSLSKSELFPTKRLNKYILYGLPLLLCEAVSIGLIAGSSKDVEQMDPLTGAAPPSIESINMGMIIGMVLYFIAFYYIRRRKGGSLRTSIFEAYYSFLLIITLTICSVALFYLGIVFLFIGLGLLILYLCLGGVGDSISVTSWDLFGSKSKKLTRELDGEWRDSSGTAYEKTGSKEWTPKE